MISRRKFLKSIGLLSLSTLINQNVLAEEKNLIISDPNIWNFYEKLISRLEKNELEYNDKESFQNYLLALEKAKKSIIEKGYKDDGLYELKDIPSEIKQNLISAKIKHETQLFKPDLFEDIENIEEYIKKNILNHKEVINLIKKVDIALFGEAHYNEEHENLENKLIRDSGKIAYIDECFQIDYFKHLEKYLLGEKANLKNLRFDEDDLETLKIVKDLKKLIVLSDVSINLNKKDFFSGLCFNGLCSCIDSRQHSIREQVFAKQIDYARNKKGLTLFGCFGDLHLRDHHLPKFLRQYGVNPLIISSLDFTVEIYDKIMEISNRNNLFFRRNNNRIIYVSNNIRNLLKSKEDYK